jgi:signal transduction histidine kinase
MTVNLQRVVDRERLRISRDIHDNLGARLTEMILLTDMAQLNRARPKEFMAQVGRLSNIAREAVRDLNVIIWAVNPKNDFVDSFAAYLAQYVEGYLGMTSIGLRIEMLDLLPHSPISSSARHSLLSVVKEAINNIVKHSGATVVWLRIRILDSTLNLELSDNGHGFEMCKASARGNGLRNMGQRLDELGGEFELSSRPGQGTTLRISLPLPRPARRSQRQWVAAH